MASISEKLAILSDAAKYDVSCSSSGSDRKNTSDGLGNAAKSGICHSWSEDGRCISLLKILMTNVCVYDCVYCINRCSNDVPRAALTPDEIVDLTMSFYRRNYIEGLFLSSGVVISPDHTTQLLIQVAKRLRLQEKFNGYIHMKGIPGTDPMLIQELGQYIDRLSVNIELPSQESLAVLAPQKNMPAIIQPMQTIRQRIAQNKEERQHFRSCKELFVPAGQTTQMIIGATGDSDRHILHLSEQLYQKMELKRVYYSAFVPVGSSPLLPALPHPPLRREHRLYQGDWLLRYYNFQASEILPLDQPNFNLNLDPKANWALHHLELFPMEINRATYEELLRIPGIGVLSAKRIVAARRINALSYENLKGLGIVLKRAIHFITCRGKYYGTLSMAPAALLEVLSDAPTSKKIHPDQLSFWDSGVLGHTQQEVSSS